MSYTNPVAQFEPAKEKRQSDDAGTTSRNKDLVRRLGAFTGELDVPCCVTCSTQSDLAGVDLEAEDAEVKCKICLDPRQYIGIHGQKWTTLRRLQEKQDPPYHNRFSELIPGESWTFKTVPTFGIGQRAFLMKDHAIQEGLVMWDCIAYLDDETLQEIDKLSDGRGIAHMVVSHPHYYSTTAVWAAAFPKMKLWLARSDFNDWYQRNDVVKAYNAGQSVSRERKGLPSSVSSQLRLVTETETQLAPGSKTQILLLGGHFPGSLVLLWKDCLFIADTIQVVPAGLYRSDQPQREGVNSVTFLWSYPNQVPLSAAEVERVCKPLEDVSFNRAFGAFEGFDIWGHAKEKILSSRDLILKRLATN